MTRPFIAVKGVEEYPNLLIRSRLISVAACRSSSPIVALWPVRTADSGGSSDEVRLRAYPLHAAQEGPPLKGARTLLRGLRQMLQTVRQSPCRGFSNRLP